MSLLDWLRAGPRAGGRRALRRGALPEEGAATEEEGLEPDEEAADEGDPTVYSLW